MKKISRIKMKIFSLIIICMIVLVQGVFVYAANNHGQARAIATQTNQNASDTKYYGGCTIYASSHCEGTEASGYANASGSLDQIDGCEYDFFDMDGFHEWGVLVNYAHGDHYASWTSSNWFSDKPYAYSGVYY